MPLREADCNLKLLAAELQTGIVGEYEKDTRSELWWIVACESKPFRVLETTVNQKMFSDETPTYLFVLPGIRQGDGASLIAPGPAGTVNLE
jgi:hypothetical protein